MTFQYFAETDMLYIQLMDAVSTESAEVAPHIVFDYDATNRVVGIEIEEASHFIDLSRLEISALPCQAMSKAVPWSGEVLMIGKPSVTFTAESNASAFNGISP